MNQNGKDLTVIYILFDIPRMEMSRKLNGLYRNAGNIYHFEFPSFFFSIIMEGGFLSVFFYQLFGQFLFSFAGFATNFDIYLAEGILYRVE